MLLFSLIHGCGKKPQTFNELIGNEEKKKNTVQKIPKVEELPKVELSPKETPKPDEPDPEKFIVHFLSIPSVNIKDADLTAVEAMLKYYQKFNKEFEIIAFDKTNK